MKKYTEYIDICIYILNICTFSPNQHDSCPYDWRGDGQTDLVPGDYGYVRPSLLGSTVMRIGQKKKTNKTIQFRSRLKHSTSGTYFCVFFICYIVI